MEYTYVLQSAKDGNFYTGWTNDLRKRFAEHQGGKVYSTKNRLPVKLVYYEACLNREDAKRREKYLKTAWGKRYLKTRLRNYRGLGRQLREDVQAGLQELNEGKGELWNAGEMKRDLGNQLNNKVA